MIDFKRSAALGTSVFLAMTAPALAQWPQPSSSELFGKFECRIANAPTCLCSQDKGSHEILYQQLIATMGAYPMGVGGKADREKVRSKWRRQCGLLEEADTTP
jgi:hypothetical protein